ncbi:MAG: protoporphyrinogen oxidase, partial [Pseudonocardia sp.]|nr:protoporphyrinogen oxidase [Pseudonocardia sp.]
MDPARIAVVGGGISGLAAAHRLRTLLGPTAAITVLEQRGRTGGVLHTAELAGMPFDVGAEAFLARRPEVPALLRELGLEGEIVHPTRASPSIRAGGRTVGLPPGTLMGVPTSHARLDDVLSPAGLAAVAVEPQRPLTWTPGEDVSLGGLLRERFGPEVPARLTDPLLGGVYAGRVDDLGLRA